MTEIVKRLRLGAVIATDQLVNGLHKDAADEIERLRAACELCEETAFMLLRTGGFRQGDRNRALTMLDRARAYGSVCEARDDNG